MNERRGAWYLLTGLIIGLALGLVYSLWVSPVEFARIAPQSLGASYKDGYRALIALAYQANGDIGRAQARLSLLQDIDPAAALAAQAQRVLAEGGQAEEARALASLSDALMAHAAFTPTTAIEPIQPAAAATGAPPTATANAPLLTPSPGEAVRSPTPGATLATAGPEPGASITLRFTPQPAGLTEAAFALQEKRTACDQPTSPPTAGLPLLQVEVLDSSGLPLPGIPILVRWDGGEETFYTGLQPQVSPGYADFRMEPGVVYSVQAGIRGTPETGVEAVTCEGEGGAYAGAVWLTFTAP